MLQSVEAPHAWQSHCAAVHCILGVVPSGPETELSVTTEYYRLLNMTYTLQGKPILTTRYSSSFFCNFNRLRNRDKTKQVMYQ